MIMFMQNVIAPQFRVSLIKVIHYSSIKNVKIITIILLFLIVFLHFKFKPICLIYIYKLLLS